MNWLQVFGLTWQIRTVSRHGPNTVASGTPLVRNASASMGNTSFGLPQGIVVVARQRSAGRYDKFGAASFDEITCLRNDALKNFENFANAGFTVDEFWERREKGSVALDRAGCAERPGSGLHFWSSGCHMRMLRLFDFESKGMLGKGRSVGLARPSVPITRREIDCPK